MRIKAVCKYKGTRYFGWQKQVNEITVQSCILEALNKILNEDINIYASGRTDAGVHALGQVFHFDLDKQVDLDKLKYSLNCVLPSDISIVSLSEVDQEFHARFSARSKRYRYIISLNEKDPINYELEYNCLYHTDMKKFVKTIELFKGKQNFKNFTSKEEDEDNFIREIYKIDVNVKDNKIIVDIFGNGFMRYMIRNIVGTSLAVAWGKEDISYIKNKLNPESERIISPYKAPPQGLYLVEVNYK